ncbi:MAG TPA: GNAT family N-acetyltransferase [Polyangia bacterium]|nr:GNAT family N-acetyltransferase [Polyangia bacterium]
MAEAPYEAERSPYSISTDPARLDLDAVWGWLRESYWSPGIPRETVARAIRHSIPFGVFEGPRQVGFARVITDRATFAYLADVYVDPASRGRGLSAWLMEVIVAHPELQGLRRWVLATRDAHGLYARFGFRLLARPELFMEIHRPDVYGGG